MKYETPELTALMPAINAIQSSLQTKDGGLHPDTVITGGVGESTGAYADWE